jgi:hypothetical protein
MSAGIPESRESALAKCGFARRADSPTRILDLTARITAIRGWAAPGILEILFEMSEESSLVGGRRWR